MEPRAVHWPESPRLVRGQVREVVQSVLGAGEFHECEVVWLAGPVGPLSGFKSGVPEMPTGGPGLNLWVRVQTSEAEWWHATWRSGLGWTQGLRYLGSNLAAWVGTTGREERRTRTAALPASLRTCVGSRTRRCWA